MVALCNFRRHALLVGSASGQEDPAPANWLAVLAWAGLLTAAACAVVILFGCYVRRYSQRMPIMEVEWPVTALYLGPVAVWGYFRYERPPTRR